MAIIIGLIIYSPAPNPIPKKEDLDRDPRAW
jgi:hypothetical protein